MPSVIYRDRRGNQTVGVRAYDQAILAPDNVAQGFKRLMGTATPLRFASTNEQVSAAVDGESVDAARADAVRPEACPAALRGVGFA